jgi:serine acetyltransferase
VVNLARLELGTGAVVQSGCLLHCGGLDWSDGRGRIRLGDRAYVGHDSILYGAGNLDIGNDVLIGPGVILTSQGHGFEIPGLTIREHPLLLAEVAIGDDVWIGAGAIVLPGVTVGKARSCRGCGREPGRGALPGGRRIARAPDARAAASPCDAGPGGRPMSRVYRSCIVCGSADPVLQQSKDGFSIVGCRGCGLVYVGEDPLTIDFDAIYGEAYYTGGSDAVFADYLGQERARRAGARRRVWGLRLQRASGRLLDVGCAAGFFLVEAKRHYQVQGVD